MTTYTPTRSTHVAARQSSRFRPVKCLTAHGSTGPLRLGADTGSSAPAGWSVCLMPVINSTANWVVVCLVSNSPLPSRWSSDCHHRTSSRLLSLATHTLWPAGHLADCAVKTYLTSREGESVRPAATCPTPSCYRNPTPHSSQFFSTL